MDLGIDKNNIDKILPVKINDISRNRSNKSVDFNEERRKLNSSSESPIREIPQNSRREIISSLIEDNEDGESIRNINNSSLYNNSSRISNRINNRNINNASNVSDNNRIRNTNDQNIKIISEDQNKRNSPSPNRLSLAETTSNRPKIKITGTNRKDSNERNKDYLLSNNSISISNSQGNLNNASVLKISNSQPELRNDNNININQDFNKRSYKIRDGYWDFLNIIINNLLFFYL